MTSPPCHRSAQRGRLRSAGARLRTSARPSLAVALAVAALALSACGGSDDADGGPDRFDSARAFELIEHQVEIGPRPAGSPASQQLAEKLRGMLPDGTFEPVPNGLRNVAGSLPGPGPAILIGAHYDTESDPPGFVGANDGAAGTAAVVELARVLEEELPDGHREVRFVLFDGEEEPPGCPDAQFARCALRGSRAYVGAHVGEVGEMILLDYIANRSLKLPREANSDKELWARLRASAEEVGVAETFPGGEQPGIIDDHVPFLRAGVPSIDLIDFSYRHADTLQDTPDKLDPAALDAVGEAVAELVLVEAGP